MEPGTTHTVSSAYLDAQTGQKEFIRQVYSVAPRHNFLWTIQQRRDEEGPEKEQRHPGQGQEEAGNFLLFLLSKAYFFH